MAKHFIAFSTTGEIVSVFSTNGGFLAGQDLTDAQTADQSLAFIRSAITAGEHGAGASVTRLLEWACACPHEATPGLGGFCDCGSYLPEISRVADPLGTPAVELKPEIEVVIDGVLVDEFSQVFHHLPTPPDACVKTTFPSVTDAEFPAVQWPPGKNATVKTPGSTVTFKLRVKAGSPSIPDGVTTVVTREASETAMVHPEPSVLTWTAGETNQIDLVAPPKGISSDLDIDKTIHHRHSQVWIKGW